ncbi:MAG: ATP-dependent RecD-like DNA helicase [Lachnospiraceae bacterium]|nr:ATP-dependent RecD-like DNA helicase [Lachnospiraceae bacterium]
MKNSIEGIVDHVIFRNEENGYTVLEIVQKDNKSITVVGNMPSFDPGEAVIFEGEYVKHPVYDLQFRMDSYEMRVLEDRESILRYLSSGAVKGIGKGLAKRIVDRFDTDSFRIIEEEPERLNEVKGISLRMAMEISAAFEQKAASRNAFSFLQQYGLSNSLIQKIYDRYKDGLYDIIRKNPYRLIEDIDGVGFRTADALAQSVGSVVDPRYRIRYGMLYVLLQAEAEGNTCLPEKILLERVQNLLETGKEEAQTALSDLSIERKVMIRVTGDGENLVFSASAFNAESECARMLNDLGLSVKEDEKKVSDAISKIQKKLDISLEDSQLLAVRKAIENGVFILTGGPGTGKTTIIRVMLEYFENEGYDILLTAPTGRAAKRMSAATGFEAATIHRTLGVGGREGDAEKRRFQHDRDTPLETDVLIVDEMSMVDIYLFRSLLSAVAYGTRLILVGDENQLPSVGPGSVLKDLIASECFEVVTLTKIYRQSEAGDIVTNAHNIRLGRQIRLDNDSKDFFFLERNNAEKIIEGIDYLISKKLPPYVGCDPGEIQVLSPMRKGILGVENLNIRLQQILNPPENRKWETETPAGVLRMGDKVMQIKNDYDLEWEITGKNGIVIETGKGVFNGDTGRIVSLSSSSIIVRFEDGRQAVYTNALFEEIELAYAITIHKSQGSEYPAVIIPVINGPSVLLNRNLLYTAVTRAKTCVVIMGSSETVQNMIENTSELKRYTGLKERLKETEILR